MHVVFDRSLLQRKNFLQHKVSGSRFYIDHLQKSLKQYFPQYTFSDVVEKNDPPDIIHYPYFDHFFLTLPLFSTYNIVVTVHDMTPLVLSSLFPSGMKGRIKWEIQKKSLLLKSAVITDSDASKKDIMKYTGIAGKNIHVVYLAAAENFKKISQKDSLIKIQQKYNLPKHFILYVGDATPNKNLPRIFDAATKAKVPLVLVGKALKEKKIDEYNPWNNDLIYIRKHSDSNLLFNLGFVPTEDLVRLYNSASALLFPSLYEGFGLPVLEAMQSGCPVITSRNGSLAEVAGDAAYFVDAHNSDDIASGIQTVLQSKVLQEDLSSKGLQQAKKFSWHKTATETVRVYEKILEK